MGMGDENMEDIEIARSIKKLPIQKVLERVPLFQNHATFYGNDMAKIDPWQIETTHRGKLILVTAISPTPYGEGKTTVSIGLHDAFRKLGKNSLLTLREPSLGPVFGMKGGATGGGYSQVVPMDEINLHFTGDFHAITAANNLLCAAIDNHLYFGNALNIDPQTICFQRCLDMNDRSLRTVTIGQSSVREVERKEHFQITAASEIMTIFCLSRSLADLRKRLERIVVAYTYDGKEVYAKDLHVVGSMMVLLKNSMMPNLVQTLEGNPVLIHGGPFANIAHGCNSIIATDLALKASDYCITEAGFGADLGAEKFLDIKCPVLGDHPSCLVLVATIKAFKYNAGVLKEDILKEDVTSVERGLDNLKAHVENLQKYHIPLVVVLNRYESDTDREIAVVKSYCDSLRLPFAITTSYRDGGNGAIALARIVADLVTEENHYQPLQTKDQTLMEKIALLAHEVYHAEDVIYSDTALKKLQELEKKGHNYLPICVAKTQYSLSDNPKLLGNPRGFTLHVTDLCLYHGAGFVTVLLGNILTMPGLPNHPNYEKIDLVDDQVVGLS